MPTTLTNRYQTTDYAPGPRHEGRGWKRLALVSTAALFGLLFVFWPDKLLGLLFAFAALVTLLSLGRQKPDEKAPEDSTPFEVNPDEEIESDLTGLNSMQKMELGLEDDDWVDDTRLDPAYSYLPWNIYYDGEEDSKDSIKNDLILDPEYSFLPGNIYHVEDDHHHH